MGLLPQIEYRYSCKKFSEEPVPKHDMQLILEAGRRAPSAKNRQPWRFIVCEGNEIRRQLTDAAYGQEHVAEAPVIMALCSTNVDYKMPNGQHAYPIDISIASAFMMLQAESMGYGSCCVTTYDERLVKEIISAPYGMRVVMLLLIGKNAENGMQKSRKTVEEISSYNHW